MGESKKLLSPFLLAAMKQRILLLDCSSVLHAVKFSLGKQRLSHNEKPTFVIYGFLLKLQYLVRKTKPDVIVYATDSRQRKRLKIYDKYKEKRTKQYKTDEQIALDKIAFPQFEELQNIIIPKLGYRNVFGTEGLEADDIIGRIAKDYKESEIILVSNDKDMYQLLSNKLCLLNPKTSQYYSLADFTKEYQIEPHLWKRVKAIGGCSSDNVPGVPIPDDKGGWSSRGVGEGTALKFVKGELPDHYKAYKAIVSIHGRKWINRNKSLVILPFRGTPSYKIRDHPSAKAMKEVCKLYGFRSILEDWDDWKRTLKMY